MALCAISGVMWMEMTDGFPEEKILTCPQCGVEVLADDLFCRKCGTRLKETEL